MIAVIDCALHGMFEHVCNTHTDADHSIMYTVRKQG